MDKQELKCNAKLPLNCFSVNVSVLGVVFCRQISKSRQFQAKLSIFFKLSAKYNSQYGNVYRKLVSMFFSKKQPHLNAVGNTKNKKMNSSPRKIGLTCVTNSQTVAHKSKLDAEMLHLQSHIFPGPVFSFIHAATFCNMPPHVGK